MTQVYLGIGSNTDREKNLAGCIKALQEIYPRLVLSSIYESAAINAESVAPVYYNFVVGLETDLPAGILINLFKGIEKHFGRGNESSSELCSLDIDLLLYADQTIVGENFTVPRNDILQYACVAIPLAEIASDLIHPVTGESIKTIAVSELIAQQSIRPIAKVTQQRIFGELTCH